jgi:hypothetical protein
MQIHIQFTYMFQKTWFDRVRESREQNYQKKRLNKKNISK